MPTGYLNSSEVTYRYSLDDRCWIFSDGTRISDLEVTAHPVQNPQLALADMWRNRIKRKGRYLYQSEVSYQGEGWRLSKATPIHKEALLDAALGQQDDSSSMWRISTVFAEDTRLSAPGISSIDVFAKRHYGDSFEAWGEGLEPSLQLHEGLSFMEAVRACHSALRGGKCNKVWVRGEGGDKFEIKPKSQSLCKMFAQGYEKRLAESHQFNMNVDDLRNYHHAHDPAPPPPPPPVEPVKPVEPLKYEEPCGIDIVGLVFSEEEIPLSQEKDAWANYVLACVLSSVLTMVSFWGLWGLTERMSKSESTTMNVVEKFDNIKRIPLEEDRILSQLQEIKRSTAFLKDLEVSEFTELSKRKLVNDVRELRMILLRMDRRFDRLWPKYETHVLSEVEKAVDSAKPVFKTNLRQPKPFFNSIRISGDQHLNDIEREIHMIKWGMDRIDHRTQKLDEYLIRQGIDIDKVEPEVSTKRPFQSE